MRSLATDRRTSVFGPRPDERAPVRHREDKSFIPQHLDGPAHRVPGDLELVLQAVLGRQLAEMLQLPGLDACPEDGSKLGVQRVMPVLVEPLTSHEANVAYETKSVTCGFVRLLALRGILGIPLGHAVLG